MAAAVAAEVDLAVEAAASTAVVVAAPVLAADTMVVITIILPIIRITDPIGVVGTSVVGILDGTITVVADAWIFSYSP